MSRCFEGSHCGCVWGFGVLLLQEILLQECFGLWGRVDLRNITAGVLVDLKSCCFEEIDCRSVWGFGVMLLRGISLR